MASKGLFHKRAFFLELVFVGLHLIQAQGQSGALQGGPNQENITIFSFQESIVFCSFLLVYVAFDSRKRDVLQATEQSVSPQFSNVVAPGLWRVFMLAGRCYSNQSCNLQSHRMNSEPSLLRHALLPRNRSRDQSMVQPLPLQDRSRPPAPSPTQTPPVAPAGTSCPAPARSFPPTSPRPSPARPAPSRCGPPAGARRGPAREDAVWPLSSLS